jgi:hypothetical protein
MKRTLVLMGALAVSGCTFPLGWADAQQGQTQEKTKADVAECREFAQNKVDGAWAGQFLLGATIVGAPAGYEWEKNHKRDLYADCLSQRGYKVTLNPYRVHAFAKDHQSQQQQGIDVNACNSEAYQAAPAGSVWRAAWSKCMNDKGYLVILADPPKEDEPGDVRACQNPDTMQIGACLETRGYKIVQ